MNANIVRLMRKDCRLHIGAFWLLLLMEVAAVAILYVQMPRNTPGLILLLTAGIAFIGDFLICYRAVISEEKNRAMLFLQTLPLSRTDIVAGKFLINGLFSTLNVGCLLLLYALYVATAAPHEPPLRLFSVSVILFMHWLASTFLVALALILDSERALWFVFSGMFVLLSAVLNYQKIIRALGLEDAARLLVQTPALSVLPLMGTLFLTFWITNQVVLRKRSFG